tara:strand:- start:3515 stop:3919 length:405 start_codon:yes stop_codon:yes gene_type:complete
MGLVIEISVNIKKISDVNSVKIFLSELAINHNCLTEYYQYETEGINNFIERSDCIQVVEFEEPLNEKEIKNITKYVNKIERNKYLKIDTIYKDSGKIKKIYSSRNYENLNMNYDYNFIQNNKPITLLVKESLLF